MVTNRLRKSIPFLTHAELVTKAVASTRSVLTHKDSGPFKSGQSHRQGYSKQTQLSWFKGQSTGRKHDGMIWDCYRASGRADEPSESLVSIQMECKIWLLLIAVAAPEDLAEQIMDELLVGRLKGIRHTSPNALRSTIRRFWRSRAS